MKTQLGSVSHGTMRPQDLIPTFAWELRRLARRAGCLRKHRKLLKEADAFDEAVDETGAPNELLDDLFDALDTFAPPYCYFGSHEGNGSDYGFWLGDLGSFDGVLLTAGDSPPRGYTGEVLAVTDHGNLTLYNYVKGRAYEVWSVV